MGFLNLFKKDKPKKKPEHTPLSLQIEWEEVGNSDTTEDDTDLPFGWVAHNKEFIEPIEKEYSYFLQSWLDARNGSPKELYSALKSFVLYMKDVEELCKSKGECYEFWFTECLTGKDYLKNRQQELDQLSKTVQIQQTEYERKQKLLPVLESSLTDFYKPIKTFYKKMFIKILTPVLNLKYNIYYMIGKNQEKSKEPR
ncbi:MAG: hypothetical protein ACLRIL_04750 [Fusicatenibacter saccharivorans]